MVSKIISRKIYNQKNVTSKRDHLFKNYENKKRWEGAWGCMHLSIFTSVFSFLEGRTIFLDFIFSLNFKGRKLNEIEILGIIFRTFWHFKGKILGYF